MKNFVNKIRKTALFTLAIAGVAFGANVAYSADTETYIVQGASKQTLTQVVQSVGGEIVHDFSVITAISASLTSDQVQKIRSSNPLLRLTNKSMDGVETAYILWGTKTKTSVPTSKSV